MINKIVNPESLHIEFSYIVGDVLQFGSPWDKYPHLPLPEGLDSDCVKAVLVDDAITLVEDPVLLAAKVLSAKQVQIADLKAAFDADVDAEMYKVYGTLDRVSASSINQSWNDINSNPSAYTPSVFPTIEVLQAYVSQKLAAATAFNIWRIGRLAQRDADIAAL